MPTGSRVPDVTTAAYAALVADATLKALLNPGVALAQQVEKVFNNVPATTVPPYLVVHGGIEELWLPTMGDEEGRQVDAVVVAISNHQGTKEVDDAVARALAVLLADSTWASLTGGGFAAARFSFNEAPAQMQLEGMVWFQRRAAVRVFLEG